MITNIPPVAKTNYKLSVRNEQRELPFSGTYEYGPENSLFLVTSSYDTLEIAAKNRPVVDILALGVGDMIAVE